MILTVILFLCTLLLMAVASSVISAIVDWIMIHLGSNND